MTAAELSRRDRNMRDKRDRIFRAASELFAGRGFTAVTTQEISDRADVGSGTLFRYASTKSDLLLMVYNEQFRAAIDEGERRSADEPDVTAAVRALVEPILRLAQRRSDNSVVYQRELMFGSHGDRHRADGLTLVACLEASIAQAITAAAARNGTPIDDETCRSASASVFATLHLAIARLHIGAHEVERLRDDLHRQIAQIITGALTMAARELPDAGPSAGSGSPESGRKQEQ